MPSKDPDYNARWHAQNRDRVSARKRAYWLANRDRLREVSRLRKAAERAAGVSRKISKDVSAYHAAKRRTVVDRQTPTWANTNATKAVYAVAAAWRLAGEDVHVDHIIPLRAELASGLHVHYNLTIVPARVNLSKRCSYGVMV